MADCLNIPEQRVADYRLVKTQKVKEPLFINIADDDSVTDLKSCMGNENLYISVCSFTKPQLSSDRLYPLYVKITSPDFNKAKSNAIESCYYFNIPEDCLELIFAGSGKTTKGFADIYEIIILVPSVVFEGFSTPLMPLINHYLAKQMAEDGIENLDIDIYCKDYYIPLPNSIQNNFNVITLTPKELSTLDENTVKELSKKPRPELFMTIPRKTPEAIEWFTEIYNQAAAGCKRRQKLLEMMMRNGWQMPYCIRFILYKDLTISDGLEALRTTTAFYSVINADKPEIWHHVQKWAQRNSYTDYNKLNAILQFAMENPRLPDCAIPLLKKFCPAGKCFMADLIDEMKRPYLFENNDKY